MSHNPLKRISLTKRSSLRRSESQSQPVQSEPSTPQNATAEILTVDEVEALLTGGLNPGSGSCDADDAAFLDSLLRQLEGESNGAPYVAAETNARLEDDAFISLEDTGLVSLLQEEHDLLAPPIAPDAPSTMDPNQARQSMAHSSQLSRASNYSGKKRSSRSASTRAGKAHSKSSRMREGAERLVSLLRSGKMPASRVRSAIARSNQHRTAVLERSKRVNESFLSIESAHPAHPHTNGVAAANGPTASQPEVVHKAPLTAGQRVARLEQNVVAARKEWESKYRVLMMVEAGTQGRPGSEHHDSRFVQHKEAVEAAAEKVLEASGDLLMAQVELGKEKLPDTQIYFYHDTRGRLQGPYKAAQLCKLAKLNVMPQGCMVLIDIAQIKGVSVRARSDDLLPLLANSANICQVAIRGSALSQPTSDPATTTTANQRSSGQNGAIGHMTDPRRRRTAGRASGDERGSDGVDMVTGGGHHGLHHMDGDLRSSGRRGSRALKDRWHDSGARPSMGPEDSQQTRMQHDEAQQNALLTFEEEKSLEVYSYEDSDGDICGPFSFNELQEKFARGAVSEPLLLMYDTDYGTTVLSVAQLFRNMTHRHEELLAANNPAPPPIETLNSTGKVSRSARVPDRSFGARTDTAASPAPLPAPPASPPEAATTFPLPLPADLPSESVGKDFGGGDATGTPDSTGPADMPAAVTQPRTDAAPVGGVSHGQHTQQTRSSTAAEAGDNAAGDVEGVVQTGSFPAWANPAGYSAAPPEGYGAAPTVPGSALPAPSFGETCTSVMGQSRASLQVSAVQLQGLAVSTLNRDVFGTEADDLLVSELMDLPSGFESFEDLLHHVAENQMEPMKQRMLRIQGSQRPALMARLDFKALRALAEAPVHIAERAIRAFVSINYEPPDASLEFLRRLQEQESGVPIR